MNPNVLSLTTKNENITGLYQNDMIKNYMTKKFSYETSMYYPSQQENKNIWRFHQNNLIKMK